MKAIEKVGLFLISQMKEKNLKRVHIAHGAQISPATINNIVAGNNLNITYEVVLKLANYFHCSIDEVLGRNNDVRDQKASFKSVTIESSMNNLKNYLKEKMEESGKDIYSFTQSCGLYRESLRGFLTKDNSKNAISANHLLILVDHFNISLDDLVGRRKDKHIDKESNSVEKTLESKSKERSSNVPVLKNIPLEDQHHIEKIKTLLKPHQTKPEDKVNTGNSPTTKVKKTSHNR